MGPNFDPAAVITAAQNVAAAAGILRDQIAGEHQAEDRLALAQQTAAGAAADVDRAKIQVDNQVNATLDAEQALINLISPPATPAATPATPTDGAAPTGDANTPATPATANA